MAVAEPSGLPRRLALLLRCKSPQTMLDILTAADGPPRLAPGRTRLYVRRAGTVETLPTGGLADPGVDEAAERTLRTGRPRRLRTGDGAVLVLPLAVDGRVLGALAAAPARRGRHRDVGAEAPDDEAVLELLADACAVRLSTLARDSPPPVGADEAAEAAETGVFAWDFATNSVYWDERACALYGIPPAAFDGSEDTFFSVLHPDDLPRVQAAIAQVTEAAVAPQAGGGPSRPGTYRIDYRVVHPDGSQHAVVERGRVVLGEDGRPTRALGLVHHSAPGPAATVPSFSPDRSRDAFLFALTRALSKAVTVRDVTRVMTDLTRPALGAENVVIGMVDHGELEVVAQTPIDPSLRHLLGPAREVMALAMDQDEPLFIEDLTRHGQLSLPALSGASRVPPRSWVVLSLSSPDHPTGACLLSFARPRRFDSGERTFFTAVAAMLAQSLERARLFDSEHQRATDLQQAMLPRRLPSLPGLATHALYLPGTREMQIGGDWYDVLPLADGTAALVIGDVQGHDAHASAVMGQLRVVLRTCAEAGMTPGRVLARASRVLGDLDTDRFATCAYLLLDLSDGSLRGARAGHPHPLRLGPERIGELLLEGGPPLGVDPYAAYPTSRARLGPRETLLLFTDGLVERRGTDIDSCVRDMVRGIEHWARAPERSGDPLDPAALTDFLTREHSGPTRSDDIAVLAVRRDG